MNKSRNFIRWGGLLLPAWMCLGYASTAHAGGEEFAHCAKKYPNNDAERLRCYDSALGAASVPAPSQAGASAPADKTTEVLPADGPAQVAGRSYLTSTWDLDGRTGSEQGRMGGLVQHRQSYLLARKTNNVNRVPISPAANQAMLGYGDTDDPMPEAQEAKFQLSFKTNIGSQQNIDFLGLKTLRLWGAYTQQSNWQIFNTRNSSPFRETNHEPELIATFGTDNPSGLKLVNLGLSHHSNGQHLPESRSWNRLYLQGGWEWGSTSLLARGWWRIPEDYLKDDNPDIVDYVGRADLVARWEPADKSQSVAVLLRNNLNLGNNRGFMQVDWSMPVALGNYVRLHAQLTSGFGESLIDYNHRQTTLGFGFSFREW